MAETLPAGDGGTLVSLAALQPLLISANVRLEHRHDHAAGVDQWLQGALVRVDATEAASAPRGREGHLVLGLLHPPKRRGHPALRVQDHRGELHLLRHGDEPVRVLAVLATRESSTHVCGGFAAGDSPRHEADIALTRGMRLSWLGNEGGLVGQLLADAPEQFVLGVRNYPVHSSGAEDELDDDTPAELHFAQHACDFDVIGLVFDSSTSQPLHIRSLCPPIPRSLTVVDPTSPLSSAASIAAAQAALPKILLVASTAASLGKTTLAARIILTLHELALERVGSNGNGNGAANGAAVTNSPRISYVKLTGSGGAEDLARIRALKTSRGQPAVSLAYDHVDAGMATTYGPGTPESIEKFKSCVTDLLALASAPCAVPPVASSALPCARTRRSGSGGALLVPVPPPAPVMSPANAHLSPPDLIVAELGSDLIWAANPILLSMGVVQSRLIGVCLLTADALAILGASSYMHGTLRFAPEKLHLFASHRCNYAGLEARVRGSDVQLHRANDDASLRELVRSILQINHIDLCHSAITAPAPAAIPTAVTQEATQGMQQHNGQQQNGASAAGAASAAAAVPASAAVAPANAQGNSLQPPAINTNAPPTVGSTPRLLAAAAESLAWAERSYVAVALPANPTVLPHRPDLSQLWLTLVEWSLKCSFVSAHAHEQPGVPLVELAARMPPAAFSWDESAVGAIVLRVSRSERLGRALAYLWLLRRRDKIRVLQAKAAEEERKAAMENSLGMLAGAKTGATAPGAKKPGTPNIATPGSSNSPGNGAGSNTTALLLSLPDYEASPYVLAKPPLSPEDSVAGRLLEVDASLASLRHGCVPARVKEETFWSTFFAHVHDDLAAYLAHQRKQ